MLQQKHLNILDMHCHILPGIDDGCRSEEMLRSMLRQASEQRVSVMVCTPHYYPVETIQEFLSRRRKAVSKLMSVKASVDFPVPAFGLGAEVAYFDTLLDQPDLHDLCIGGTDYMLLEMPFHAWTRRSMADVARLPKQYGIHPIMAHLERYRSFIDDETIDALLYAGARIQMNGETLLNRKTAGTAKKLLQAGVISLLGSDTHDPVHRPQTMGNAYRCLSEWGMQELAEKISANSIAVLRNQ